MITANSFEQLNILSTSNTSYDTSFRSNARLEKGVRGNTVFKKQSFRLLSVPCMEFEPHTTRFYSILLRVLTVTEIFEKCLICQQVDCSNRMRPSLKIK